jgi:hypothetical protein
MAAKKLGVEIAVVRAVFQTETEGKTYASNGRIKILYERHYFSCLIHRKYPNAKLIRNAQEELTNHKAVYRLLLSFTTGTEYVQKKETRKSQEQLPQNYGGK